MRGSKQHHTRSFGLSIGRWPNVTAFDHTASAFQRATKGRKSRPFGVYRKVLADRAAAKSFSKYEIVKGIACPGLHRQRRCDIIARWRCRCARAHVGNIAARVEDAVSR